MKLVALLLLLLLALAGCDGRIEKHYHFNSSVISTEYGDIGATIEGKLGKPSRFSRSMELGNPYHLKINFSSDKEEHVPHIVKAVNIRSHRGNSVHSFKRGELEVTWSDFDNSWVGSWTIQGLQLRHEPISLDFKIVFSIEDENVEKSYTIDFEPFYHEEYF